MGRAWAGRGGPAAVSDCVPPCYTHQFIWALSPQETDQAAVCSWSMTLVSRTPGSLALEKWLRVIHSAWREVDIMWDIESIYKTFLIYSFLCLCRVFSSSTWALDCIMCDLLLQPTDSLVVTCGLPSTWPFVFLVHGLSCPAACGILVPGPGIKPEYLALAGGFLTTGPPGKF